MSVEIKRLKSLAVCWGAGLCLTAHAQLGQGNADGLRMTARAAHRSGISTDMDCSLAVTLRGDKLTNASALSLPKVLKVIDDTGADLVRTNRRFLGASDLPPLKESWPNQRNPSFSLQLWFKAPATNARALRLIEWETVLQRSNNAPETLRLRLENVRLPWFDPPRLQVMADVVDSEPGPEGAVIHHVRLTFLGGPVPGCAGVRDVRFGEAQTADGRAVTITPRKYSPSNEFTATTAFSGEGPMIQRDIRITAPADATAVRIGKSEAELFFPTKSNGGQVEFTSLPANKGHQLEHSSLRRHHASITFLGYESFERKRRAEPTDRVRWINVLPSPPLNENAVDSIHFSVTDPEARLGAFSFLDRDGKPLHLLTQMIESQFHSPRSNRWHLYTFKEPLPPEIRLAVPVITAESLERIPFAVERITLR